MAGWTGLEPATSGLTGQRSNQLNYHPIRNAELKAEKDIRTPALLFLISEFHFIYDKKMVGGTGLEPVTPAL
jgi:hypothetical protein